MDLRSLLLRWMKPKATGNAFKAPPGLFLGVGCRILGQPRLKIIEGASIACGANVVLNSEPQGYHAGMSFPVTLFADRPDARIEIGDESRLHGCCIHAWSNIVIGRKCLIAAGSQILDAHGHATELVFARIRTFIQDEPQPIKIGDYSWIGLNALVLKGVLLNEGCIVAANSVVTAGEYPPFSLLAGSPAKVIRQVSPMEVFPEDISLESLPLSGKKLYKY